MVMPLSSPRVYSRNEIERHYEQPTPQIIYSIYMMAEGMELKLLGNIGKGEEVECTSNLVLERGAEEN